MNVEYVPAENHKRFRWSGGESMTLLIWPPHATYDARDFLVYCSRATMEVEESNYTDLPDYDRQLAMLDGAVTLTHAEPGRVTHVTPFETVTFDGAWATTCRGMAADIGLMLKKGEASGALHVVPLAVGEAEQILLAPDEDAGQTIHLLYIERGEGTIAGQPYWAQDAFLLTEAQQGEQVMVIPTRDSVLAIVQVLVPAP